MEENQDTRDKHPGSATLARHRYRRGMSFFKNLLGQHWACFQVAQVVARELGISMELIKLKASSAITSPNNTTTGGSMGSEMNCFVSFLLFFSCFFQKLLLFFFRFLNCSFLFSS
jgi:hypothetical protein